ncbi:MAG: CRISPR-associated protein Cas4 [Christensenellaceae bacterium]|jgi:CRISPR-associated exonuclease Cas4|nr:CRISPR-associated protein Cas4 [Christensenellaceae bacterium]
MYKEEEYLSISGIMDYVVCRRRWALHNLEQIWLDNWRTTDGSIMHKKAHDSCITEKRKDVVTVNALKVVSKRLGVFGECDVVQFCRNDDGVYLQKYKDKFIPFPIEYKRGKGASIEADKMQLCVQAMCLEEMLCCKIERGALFYGEPHRRTEIEFTIDLRANVEKTLNEMHKLLKFEYTPKPVSCKFCNECSLKDICLPKLIKNTITVKEYLQGGLK